MMVASSTASSRASWRWRRRRKPLLRAGAKDSGGQRGMRQARNGRGPFMSWAKDAARWCLGMRLMGCCDARNAESAAQEAGEGPGRGCGWGLDEVCGTRRELMGNAWRHQ